jgi:hypothetical protein
VANPTELYTLEVVVLTPQSAVNNEPAFAGGDLTFTLWLLDETAGSNEWRLMNEPATITVLTRGINAYTVFQSYNKQQITGYRTVGEAFADAEETAVVLSQIYAEEKLTSKGYQARVGNVTDQGRVDTWVFPWNETTVAGWQVRVWQHSAAGRTLKGSK